jgi:hypothetical protein
MESKFEETEQQIATSVNINTWVFQKYVNT